MVGILKFAFAFLFALIVGVAYDAAHADAMTFASSSVLAYWTMDETSGTRADSAGSNDLTDNNTVVYRTGVLGNAADFTTANSEYLSIVDASTNVDFEHSAWTFGYWIYHDSYAGDSPFAKSYNPSAYTGFGCAYNTNWIQCFSYFTASQDLNFTSTTVADGAWAHYVFVKTGSSMLLYKNGALSQTLSLSGSTLTGNTKPLVLGASYWTTVQGYLDGAMDEVFYLDAAASSTDITAIYNSGAGLAFEDWFAEEEATTTATTTTLELSTEDIIYTIALAFSILFGLIFTYIGYKFFRIFI